MQSANWDNDYDLSNKTVAVIGGGSPAVQIIPSIQPKVKKLIPYLRSSVWITAGFGAKYEAPGGVNFEYSEVRRETFRKDDETFNQYCRDVEGELNKRFTLVRESLRICQYVDRSNEWKSNASRQQRPKAIPQIREERHDRKARRRPSSDQSPHPRFRPRPPTHDSGDSIPPRCAKKNVQYRSSQKVPAHLPNTASSSSQAQRPKSMLSSMPQAST
jgi:hypothetical protein